MKRFFKLNSNTTKFGRVQKLERHENEIVWYYTAHLCILTASTWRYRRLNCDLFYQVATMSNIQ